MRITKFPEKTITFFGKHKVLFGFIVPIVLFGILSFFFLVSSRYVAKKILEYFDFLQTPVLIIGAGKTARKVRESCKAAGAIRCGHP